jgi:acetoin:2,6-dichlorophenolindophenol oxidoreductase subunit beta
MQTEPRERTLAQAINDTLREEMDRDETVLVLGEDVASYGGVYKLTHGLLERFGPERVLDTPISEAGIVGVAVGAALTGRRPVVEVMFGDFLTLAMDQLVNQAAKAHYMSGGTLRVPLVIRTTMGAGRRLAAQHSQSLHAWFAHVPGLKVVLPATPADARGLLKSAIRSDDPVLFFEDKLMYRERGLVPVEEYVTPLGVAEVKRVGTDVTVVATSRMVGVALAAADQVAQEGVSIEVVDPRTLTPLDEETIVESVQKTSRCVIVDGGHLRFGVAAEIAAVVARRAFEYLDAPVERVCALDVPIPFSPTLEDETMPSAEKVSSCVRELVG